MQDVHIFNVAFDVLNQRPAQIHPIVVRTTEIDQEPLFIEPGFDFFLQFRNPGRLTRNCSISSNLALICSFNIDVRPVERPGC